MSPTIALPHSRTLQDIRSLSKQHAPSSLVRIKALDKKMVSANEIFDFTENAPNFRLVFAEEKNTLPWVCDTRQQCSCTFHVWPDDQGVLRGGPRNGIKISIDLPQDMCKGVASPRA